MILKPNNKEILIDGFDASDLNLKSWRKLIGYVSQDIFLFDDTIKNNITMWNEKIHDNELDNAIKLSNLKNFIDNLPQGLNTKIGEAGIKVSGGQRQRISIARELYRKPSILILDEATSSLDSESEKEILNSLDALNGKMTIIIIAHKLINVKKADLIYVMREGMLVEKGNFEELSKKSKYFKNMLSLQKIN